MDSHQNTASEISVNGTALSSVVRANCSSFAVMAAVGRWAMMPQPVLCMGAKPASMSTPSVLMTRWLPSWPDSTCRTTALFDTFWPTRLPSSWKISRPCASTTYR